MGAEESKSGYQVSRVIASSPAHAAGLLPFFDFVMGVDGVPFEDDTSFFKDYLRTHLQQSITLDVYNTRVKNTRRVPITPNEHWGGQGVLGCSITWENVERAFLYAWRILEVSAESNAEAARFRPYTDYVIGMEAIESGEMHCTMFSDEQDFHQRLAQVTSAIADPQNPRYQNESVLLLVHNVVDNTIRETLVGVPLGCEVGSGLMHAITASKGDPRLPVITHFHAPSTQQASEYGRCGEQQSHALRQEECHVNPNVHDGAPRASFSEGTRICNGSSSFPQFAPQPPSAQCSPDLASSSVPGAAQNTHAQFYATPSYATPSVDPLGSHPNAANYTSNPPGYATAPYGQHQYAYQQPPGNVGPPPPQFHPQANPFYNVPLNSPTCIVPGTNP